MINIRIPTIKNREFVEKFFIKKNLKNIVELSKNSKNKKKTVEPYKPDLFDLYRLYQFVVINKRTTILEFGSGWSSLILSLALKEVKDKFFSKVKHLRRNNPFELFIIENEKKFMNISRNRIKKFYKNMNIKKPIKINWHYSEVEMTLFNNKICTQYKKLPLCNPDFIYLDGPDQFNIKKDINGISVRHKDMAPMVCDILKFEYFYTPGTIIVCDGRSANAQFLKKNFQRKWRYSVDKKFKQHIFWLDDQILGDLNRKQLEFYKK